MRRSVAKVVPTVEFLVEVSELHFPRKGLVFEFLFVPAVDLFLVVVGLGEVAAAVGEVGVVGLFVEPETGTPFPLGAAGEAELGTAATCHVVAAFDLLHRRFAVVAALPAFFFGDLDEFLGCGVFGTLARGVPFVVAEAADLCLAALAFAVFAAVIGSAICVGVDVGGFDPLAASFGGTVDSVLGGVFLVLPIPLYLEIVIKKLYDMFQWDAILGATFRWHMLWVRDRKVEDAAEAGVAHSVRAGKFRASRDADVVRETSNAGDAAVGHVSEGL